MSLIDVKVTVNLGGAFRMLSRMQRIDVRKTFKRVEPSARHDQQQHDRALEGPDGRWPQLAASTIERRTRPRGRDKKGRNRSWPTKLLGRMPKSIQSITSSKSLIIRSRVKKFSMVHQAGGIVGHGARIPRRQYLWISQWLKDRTRIEFMRALAAAAAGTP